MCPFVEKQHNEFVEKRYVADRKSLLRLVAEARRPAGGLVCTRARASHRIKRRHRRGATA